MELDHRLAETLSKLGGGRSTKEHLIRLIRVHKMSEAEAKLLLLLQRQQGLVDFYADGPLYICNPEPDVL